MARQPKSAYNRRCEAEASAYLWSVLSCPGRARRIWVDFAARNGLAVVPGRVSQEAVRRVLLIWAHDEGHFAQDPEQLELLQRRPWKDRVSRVARGVHLDITLLEAFIGAFELNDEHANRLRALWDGTSPPAIPPGTGAMP